MKIWDVDLKTGLGKHGVKKVYEWQGTCIWRPFCFLAVNVEHKEGALFFLLLFFLLRAEFHREVFLHMPYLSLN